MVSRRHGAPLAPQDIGEEGSAFVRYELAMGKMPVARVHGWVERMTSFNTDDRPVSDLVARYGARVRAECRAAGFEPACDVPLRRQSPAAQAAAKQWAEQLLRESTY